MSWPNKSGEIADAKAGGATQDEDGKWRYSKEKKHSLAKKIKAKGESKEHNLNKEGSVRRMSPMKEISKMAEHLRTTKKGATGSPSHKMKY